MDVLDLAAGTTGTVDEQFDREHCRQAGMKGVLEVDFDVDVGARVQVLKDFVIVDDQYEGL